MVNMKSKNEKYVVIGFFPAPLAEGKEFLEAHIRFFDGKLFHPLFDALVYGGYELVVGGRKLVWKNGAEFGIVRFATEENIRKGLIHGEAPGLADAAGRKASKNRGQTSEVGLGVVLANPTPSALYFDFLGSQAVLALAFFPPAVLKPSDSNSIRFSAICTSSRAASSPSGSAPTASAS